MKKIIIAAVSKNNVIGKEGKLPWHIDEELNHFKKITVGFPVIMGRKTWETIKKPLANRINIIISKNPNFSFSNPNVVICRSINEALEYSETRNFEKVFFIGGSEIFTQTINIADEIILSRMNFEAQGDKYFVNLNVDDWEIQSIEKHDEFEVYHYLRKRISAE